jgi:hypothetical protein
MQNVELLHHYGQGSFSVVAHKSTDRSDLTPRVEGYPQLPVIRPEPRDFAPKRSIRAEAIMLQSKIVNALE